MLILIMALAKHHKESENFKWEKVEKIENHTGHC